MIGVAIYMTTKTLWKRHKNTSIIARIIGYKLKDSN
jgi:hypothetical protein